MRTFLRAGILAGSVIFLGSCGVHKSDPTTTTSGTPPTPGSCAAGPTSLNINIFNENPRTSSGNSSLAFTSTLTTAMTVPATLSGLTGNCLLQSSRYSILSDGLYPSNVLSATATNEGLAPTAPEFEQLNGFYYATTLYSLATSLGASLSGQIAIDAHCNQADNAYFSPSSMKLCFGYHDLGGGKKTWAADDADVIVHESGHTVNHGLASTAIMNSTEESGAVDEGLADYWALTVNGNAQLSEWFLGSIGAGYIRDASLNLVYPNSQDYEIHDDSRVLSEVLWDLRDPANLGKTNTDKLVKRALQLLPATTRFADFYQAFYDASGPSFLNLNSTQRALIVTKFTAHGLHRVDTATGLRLSTTATQVRVIDDHTYSFQSGGNCNGTLDVGETALVLVNLENPNAGAMGVGVATINSPPSGITVLSGGEIGEYFRLKGSSDFVSSLPASSSTRNDAVLMASFILKATSAGVKNMSLTFKPMYADPTGAVSANPDVTVNFSLTVGSAATSTSCSSAGLWP